MKTLKKLIPGLFMFLMLGCKDNPKVPQKGEDVVETEINTEESLYRPNFHFTPRKNWMNDPNGMFYYNGTFHLYFQYHPDSNVWGPMHWGHAVSLDMISWEEKPIALYPDELGTIFSGSAVVDLNNTSGFGKGKDGVPIVAMYTSSKQLEGNDNWKQTQSIAFSNDEGHTFTKYENNPVLDNDGLKDFRDPKILWDDDRGRWTMVLAAGDRIMFYESKDLKSWNYLSDFGKGIGGHGGVWECPDLFKLPVNGTEETKWVLFVSINPGGPNGGSATQYFVGDFDGTKFKMDSDFSEALAKDHNYWIDYGMDNYAGVSWSNTRSEKGNILMIGWMSNWLYAQKVPTLGWRSAMTIAREVELQRNELGYRLRSLPVKEIENYRGKKFEKKGMSISGETVLVDSSDVDLSHAEISFKISELSEITKYIFKLSNKLGEELLFGYDSAENVFFIDRSKSGIVDFSEEFSNKPSFAPRTSLNKSLTCRIILDKTSIELFYDDGETVMTEIFFPKAPYDRISVKPEKQEFILDSLEGFELNVTK